MLLSRAVAAGLLSIGLAPPAAAQPAEPQQPPTVTPAALTYEAAWNLASTRNADLAAALRQRAIREAEVRVAGQRPNPDVSFEITRDTPHEAVSFGLPLEIGGQRARRIELAREQMSLADLDVRTAERTLRRNLRQAFYGLVFADERVRDAEAVLGIVQRVRDISNARFTEGAAPKLEVMEADLGVARAEAGLETARSARAAVQAALNAVLNQPPGQGTSLPETDRMMHGIEAILKETPEVSGFVRRTGAELGLFATAQNTGDFVVKLKDRSARSRSANEVIASLREEFAANLPGLTIEFMQLLQDMLGDLEGNPEPVEVKLFGEDMNVLSGLAERVEAGLKKIDGVVDIVKPQRGNPELMLQIQPTRAAKAGFTNAQISEQLADGLLGDVQTSIRRGDRLVDVRVRYPDRVRFDLGWLTQFPLVTAAGNSVPLSAVADISTVQGVSELSREDLLQMVPVTARLEGRDLGSGIRDVKAMMDGMKLPVGYSYAIGGLYESQQASFRSMIMVLAVALLLVFAVLVAQFRRFSSALIILSAAPLSLVGAFGLLIITGTPLNVSSFMGLILLIGLIVKNGIILIDYTDMMREQEPDPIEALVRAGSIRLRPILMTTLCTLFGLLPLALGLGAGAEMQKPLAIAVIGGLSVSTIITLVFVPTLVLLVGKRRSPAR